MLEMLVYDFSLCGLNLEFLERGLFIFKYLLFIVLFCFTDHHRDCSGITLTMTFKP